MPSLIKERYPERFSLGLIAGTGSVGLLFPPALPLFIYGTVYGVNDQLTGGGSGFTTDRFLFAGIVPGMVLVGLLAAMAITVAVVRKIPVHRLDLRLFAKSFVVALPEIALPFLIIGALAKGVVIAEIASLTVLYVLFVEVVIYRDLKITALWRITRESMALVGAIFIIILAASALTNFFVTAEVPTRLVDWISSHVDAQWKFLLALNLFLIAVGMMMDIFSAIVIVVPLITPLAKQYGIDPFHLGVNLLAQPRDRVSDSAGGSQSLHHRIQIQSPGCRGHTLHRAILAGHDRGAGPGDLHSGPHNRPRSAAHRSPG